MGYFILLGVIILIYAINYIYEKKKDAKILTTTVTARVIAKRMPSLGRAGSDYFVTFELESGERIELNVSGSQYGLCMEGDDGILKHKEGKTFVSFERIIDK